MIQEKIKAAYQSLCKKIIAGEAVNPIKVRVSSRSEDGFRSAVKIRNFDLISDQPYGFAGSNQGPKPSELVLAALATCQEVTWRLYAAAMDIPLDGIRVELEGEQDLRGFFSLDETVNAGFQSMKGTVYIDSPADDETLESLRKIVDAHCPVLDDLRRPVSVELGLEREASA